VAATEITGQRPGRLHDLCARRIDSGRAGVALHDACGAGAVGEDDDDSLVTGPTRRLARGRDS